MAREERSAGFIAFCPVERAARESCESTRQYLLLDHAQHWSFPKGHVERGEDDLTAAIRELEEETGLINPRVVSGFRQEINYFFRNRRRGLIHKWVVYFLAAIPSSNVVLSSEHIGSELLPFEGALKRLTFPADRDVLRAAELLLKTLDSA